MSINIKPLAASAASAVLLLAACTTFNREAPKSDELVQDGSPVVMQVGRTDPEVSPHERSYWLEQRQSKGMSGRVNGSLASGEAETAVNLAKARLAQKPGDEQALIMLASGLVMMRNYELAAYYANMLEQTQPGSAVALNIKGLAKALGPASKPADYAQAAALFQQAMDADQGQVAPGLNLGYLQLELGNATGAATTFKTVADRCHSCIASLLGEGIALSRSRQFPAAVTVFTQVLDQRPNHPVALYNLALVYKNGYNNKAKAESYLTALLHDSRTQDKALRERAQVVLRMVKGEAAAEDRTQIADDAPPSSKDQEDAAALMTGAAADDKEEEP